MTDRSVPNLPSRDFASSVGFYGRFGFFPTFRDDTWLILRRGAIELEFFPFPDLEPYASSFSASSFSDDRTHHAVRRGTFASGRARTRGVDCRYKRGPCHD